MNDNKVYYVYVHKREDTKDIFYVGKGKGRRAWSKGRRSKWWTRIAEKYGYSVERVKDELEEGDAFDLERLTIRRYKESGSALCNISSGGEGKSCAKPMSVEGRQRWRAAVVGRKMPEETKAKISATKLSKKHKHSLESISKMRLVKLGKIVSEETKSILSKSLKGRKKSEETRRRMSASKVFKAVECSNGMVFDSAILAAKWLTGSSELKVFDTKRKGVLDCCNGRYKTSYGYSWKYV